MAELDLQQYMVEVAKERSSIAKALLAIQQTLDKMGPAVSKMESELDKLEPAVTTTNAPVKAPPTGALGTNPGTTAMEGSDLPAPTPTNCSTKGSSQYDVDEQPSAAAIPNTTTSGLLPVTTLVPAPEFVLLEGTKATSVSPDASVFLCPNAKLDATYKLFVEKPLHADVDLVASLQLDTGQPIIATATGPRLVTTQPMLHGVLDIDIIGGGDITKLGAAVFYEALKVEVLSSAQTNFDDLGAELRPWPWPSFVCHRGREQTELPPNQAIALLLLNGHPSVESLLGCHNTTCLMSKHMGVAPGDVTGFSVGKMQFGSIYVEYLRPEQDKYLAKCSHVEYKSLKKVLKRCRLDRSLQADDTNGDQQENRSDESSDACDCNSCTLGDQMFFTELTKEASDIAGYFSSRVHWRFESSYLMVWKIAWMPCSMFTDLAYCPQCKFSTGLNHWSTVMGQPSALGCLRDAWNMVEGINSWPAQSLLLEIVLGVHISWRWHLLKDGIDPCRSGRHELVSVHASLVNALDRNLMLPWDPGGSRYVCWVLNNKQFAGIIKVSFMNMLLDLNGNALVDTMADIGKLSTFIQLAQKSVNLLVINELGNCTFVLLYAMSTFTTYLGNSGIGVACHVFNSMPAWRRNAFSPGHSAICGDHLLLKSIQSRGRSAFSLSQYGIGGVQYVVDKLPSLSRNAFSLGNSVMQASPAMWFSFFSQCHTTQFSTRNWDPGIALTKSKEQLTILILQWFRFSTWLMLLWGGWPNGGRNYSLYQLLGHNLSLTEQLQLHMIGVVGPTKEQDYSNSAMTATSMRPTHITNWLVQMEIKCSNHILRFSQLLANGILLLLFFLVILKAEFKEASHNDWSYTPSPIPEHIVIKFTHRASKSPGISRDVGNTTFKLQFYILMIDDP